MIYMHTLLCYFCALQINIHGWFGQKALNRNDMYRMLSMAMKSKTYECVKPQQLAYEECLKLYYVACGTPSINL